MSHTLNMIAWMLGGPFHAPMKGMKGRLPFAIQFAAYLTDCLDWGPQHVDLAMQHHLRQAYFRTPFDSVIEQADYLQMMQSGSEVVFLCEPILGNCLAVLWMLECLALQNADLRHASLLIAPVRWRAAPPSADELVRQHADRVPVMEVLESLRAIRRHLSSDSDEVRADLSGLPERVAAWVRVTDRLEDLLPDERGLDLLDSILLDALARDQSKIRVADPEGFVGVTRFRLTPLGRRVRRGQEDALSRCAITRWVGGRLISRDRPLRRVTDRGERRPL